MSAQIIPKSHAFSTIVAAMTHQPIMVWAATPEAFIGIVDIVDSTNIQIVLATLLNNSKIDRCLAQDKQLLFVIFRLIH